MSRRARVKAFLVAALLTLSAGCTPGGTGAGPGVSSPSRGSAIQVRPGDEALAATVRARLAEADRLGFRGVSVLVWDGSVLLTGAVVRPEQRRRAEQIVRAVDGVVQVHGELQMAEEAILAGFAPDSERERALLGALAVHSDLAGSYTVRVVHGVAYLLGSAPRRADAARVADLIREVPDIKWVVDRVAVLDGRTPRE
jgi:osmotically-inducible protein OsmY